MAKSDYSLLEHPKGTTMYLLFADRQGHNLDLKEVEYQGFKESSRIDHWPRDAYSPETYQTQETFTISFTDKKNGLEIKVSVDNVSYWKGQRAFDTEEHLTCGHAPYPYIDVYFTVSKDKLKEYLTKNKLLSNLEKYMHKVCDSYDTIISIINKKE